MKLNDAFPSNYLKSEDFAEGEEKDVVIAKVVLEKMTNRDNKEENKPVLHFSNSDKQMVVKATNWKLPARKIRIIGSVRKSPSIPRSLMLLAK